MYFFFDLEALYDSFSDRTSFKVKSMHSIAQFNYSTAKGDSLVGVSIFAKFEYRDYRERNELLKISHFVETRLGRVGRYRLNAKAKKREKLEDNIVRLFGVVFSKIKTSCSVVFISCFGSVY